MFAQQSVYSGSDDKLKYNVKVEQLTDKVNDIFLEYYVLYIKNTSNSDVTFKPVFNYKDENGVLKNSLSHDQFEPITLKPGESIKGDYRSKRELTLFKEFLIGNSGQKASDAQFKFESISTKY
ncbi:hypothetical protein DIT68_00480 [Brumimicrobium oceani]|uniref:DUF4352 domain-containing protein n=2 Tax=Brumimicrobium oceani TaxID=2100725 RepID=A0A2U2XG55_9FLAO|nr:hypothetical protein DIT68_00480 [Brumimicrobium oceani]